MRVYLLILFLLGAVEAQAALSVHSDFPGGSARVTAVNAAAQTLTIAPTPFNHKGWDCWWYFRVDGVNTNLPLRLSVKGMSFARPDRAVISTDQRTWVHSEPAVLEKGAHTYTIAPPATRFWLAWGPPFLLEDARQVVAQAAVKCAQAEAITLTISAEDHAVPALKIAPTHPKTQVWIQARQHAWECGASWVCKGLIDWLVSDEAAALRATTAFMIVPVMDADNVQRGAGGKNQFPQDHNRDWSEQPHWPEVAAAQKGIRAMDASGNFVLFVDLHNPAPRDREPFYFLAPDDSLSAKRKRRQNLFLAQSKQHMANEPLPFKGRTKVSGKNYDKNWAKISKNWVVTNTRSPAVAVTLETSWNTPQSTAVNYQKTGAALGRAIAGFVGKIK